MTERIQAFRVDPYLDGQYPAADFYGETTTTEPGDEPGFFDGKNSEELDSLGWYLQSLGEVPKFTTKQEIELAKRIEAGEHAEQLSVTCDDDKRRELAKTIRDGEVARSQLIHSVLPLVVHIVKHDYWGDLPLTDIDMVQCGNVGAVRAVSAYDYTLGVGFGKTYAEHWIHKEIKAGLGEAKPLVTCAQRPKSSCVPIKLCRRSESWDLVLMFLQKLSVSSPRLQASKRRGCGMCSTVRFTHLR